MNRFRDSLLVPQNLHRYAHHQHPIAPHRLLADLCSVRRFCFLPRLQPAAVGPPSSTVLPLRRHYGGTASSPRSTATQFVLRWYHDPRKVAVATAISLSAAVLAATSRYGRETVPCTNRSHLVVLSQQAERELGESVFADQKDKYEVVDPRDPDSVRVRLIAERIIRAANRGLGIDDGTHSGAPMLRVTEKKRRRKWWTPEPQTSHLHGLQWEIVLVKDDFPGAICMPGGKIIVYTGLLHWYNTDDEIAANLAHEVGHLIARHEADINNSDWLPTSLWWIFRHRSEIEADYIGIMLLGAAGFDPRWALVVAQKQAKVAGDSLRTRIHSTHPTSKKRLQILSEDKTIEKAMELYREVTAMDEVAKRYFKERSDDYTQCLGFRAYLKTTSSDA